MADLVQDALSKMFAPLLNQEEARSNLLTRRLGVERPHPFYEGLVEGRADEMFGGGPVPGPIPPGPTPPPRPPAVYGAQRSYSPPPPFGTSSLDPRVSLSGNPNTPHFLGVPASVSGGSPSIQGGARGSSTRSVGASGGGGGAMPEPTAPFENTGFNPGNPSQSVIAQTSAVGPQEPNQDPRTPSEDAYNGLLFNDEEISNILLDLGAAMMAGESPYFLSNVGRAAQTAIAQSDVRDDRNFDRKQQEFQNSIAEHTMGIQREQLALDYARYNTDASNIGFNQQLALKELELEQRKVGLSAAALALEGANKDLDAVLKNLQIQKEQALLNSLGPEVDEVFAEDGTGLGVIVYKNGSSDYLRDLAGNPVPYNNPTTRIEAVKAQLEGAKAALERDDIPVEQYLMIVQNAVNSL